MRAVVWVGVGVAVLLVAAGSVPAAYVFGPLAGLGIWKVGTATFRSLAAGAAFVPDGPPRPVDPRVERLTYWCEGCGAELLLLVRGTDVPPRHCGERMTERTETPRDAHS